MELNGNLHFSFVNLVFINGVEICHCLISCELFKNQKNPESFNGPFFCYTLIQYLFNALFFSAWIACELLNKSAIIHTNKALSS